MTRYDPLYAAIARKHNDHKSPSVVDAVDRFPLKQMYQSQFDLYNKIPDNTSLCLSCHTGWGKTAFFLSLIRDEPAIVIEPRKFLQTQVSKYYNDFVLFGRSGYSCPLALASYDGSKTAAMAPCLSKEDCSGTDYHATCQNANSTCLNKPCTIFKVGDTYAKYPCSTCDYIDAQKEAQSVLRRGGVVVCNFGNFWNLLKEAKTVVIDEADLFFREISAPAKLKYSNPKKNANDDIKTLLAREARGLIDAIKTASSPKMKYAAKNLLYSVQFLQTYADLCFMYQRKDAFYIEIDPRNVSILAKKIFHDKRVIIVSATPGAFDYPSYSSSIHQRCGLYFAPVGNLTSRSLKANPYLMSQAARAITEISTYMELVYDADRVIVHCGNLGTHAKGLYSILGDQDCVLHESGKLNETIQQYLASGKKYLLIAAAEYGLDAEWCKLQFVLKFPYPNLDERMRTLERTMGPDFKAYYEGEARTRIVQVSGRNVRGFDDFGVTVSLDSKIYEDYMKNRDKYPDWFRNRVDVRCY